MCLYPKLITNRKYTKNQKNGGVIPPMIDWRVASVPIGCGNCIECRKQKSREWSVRLKEDIKEHKNGQFVTLTFSYDGYKEMVEEAYKVVEKEIIEAEKIECYKERDKQIRKCNEKIRGYGIENTVAKVATRLFLERWRKKYKKSVRHWLVTELGGKGTERVHMHGIIWTDNVKDIEKIWKYGKVWDGYDDKGKRINYVNEKTINYCVKYISKIDILHSQFKSKILTSAGIGSRYTKVWDSNRNKYKDKDTVQTYKDRSGIEIALAKYWRNKIYTEEEKEKMWINMLDKQERYVCGERVSIKNGEEEYYKLVEWYRKKNSRLGYGNDKGWEKKKYEEERREMMKKNAYGVVIQKDLD